MAPAYKKRILITPPYPRTTLGHGVSSSRLLIPYIPASSRWILSPLFESEKGPSRTTECHENRVEKRGLVKLTFFQSEAARLLYFLGSELDSRPKLNHPIAGQVEESGRHGRILGQENEQGLAPTHHPDPASDHHRFPPNVIGRAGRIR